jgi:tetratricopeptide (TPR) repeat protein
MKQTWRRWQSGIAAILLLGSGGVVRAADDAATVVSRALDLVEDHDAREAVAVLADGARRYPQDRKLGGLLYTLLRDKRWPLPATLPVKLPAAITAIDLSQDCKFAIAGAEDGTVRILDTETGKLLDAIVKHPGAIVGVAVDGLIELFEAAPADPLLFAAVSLYVPTQRRGEYLAEYALALADENPLARAYVASTFAKYGRLEEAERVMQSALAAAPDDPRVLRRAAKLDARQNRKEAAIEKMERTVKDNPEDKITYRDYGWTLYNLNEPAKAFEQFKKADDLAGGADQDIGAGLCLSAAGMGDTAAAATRYKRLIKISAEWGDADHLKQLTGWSEKELAEMQRIRALAMKP